MPDALTKYNPDLTQPQPGDQLRVEDLRLLNDSSAKYDEVTLLSKRRARILLRIGNDSLNKLIEKGEIRTILVNGRVKIPYVSLQEYVYNMSSKSKCETESHENISEEESVALANKLLYEFNKGDK